MFEKNLAVLPVAFLKVPSFDLVILVVLYIILSSMMLFHKNLLQFYSFLLYSY